MAGSGRSFDDAVAILVAYKLAERMGDTELLSRAQDELDRMHLWIRDSEEYMKAVGNANELFVLLMKSPLKDQLTPRENVVEVLEQAMKEIREGSAQKKGAVPLQVNTPKPIQAQGEDPNLFWSMLQSYLNPTPVQEEFDYVAANEQAQAIKTPGEKFWSKEEELLRLLQEDKKKGVYPYPQILGNFPNGPVPDWGAPSPKVPIPAKNKTVVRATLFYPTAPGTLHLILPDLWSMLKWPTIAKSHPPVNWITSKDWAYKDSYPTDRKITFVLAKQETVGDTIFAEYQVKKD